MKNPLELTRYERFGWHYDALAADRYRPGEAGFYRDLALRCAGPVLEPACGSGRILSLPWRAGLAVTGTDASQTMLQRARQRFSRIAAAADLPLGPYRFVCQPLQVLDLGRQFALILLPLEAFRLLRDRSEQEQFLLAAAAHLLPGGRLAMDLTLPEAELPSRTSLGPVAAPEGCAVSATVRWRQEADFTVEETTFHYPRGAEEVVTDRYRNLRADELLDILAAGGWRVESCWSDHQGTGFERGAGRMVLTACFVGTS